VRDRAKLGSSPTKASSNNRDEGANDGPGANSERHQKRRRLSPVRKRLERHEVFDDKRVRHEGSHDSTDEGTHESFDQKTVLPDLLRPVANGKPVLTHPAHKVCRDRVSRRIAQH